MKKIYSIIRGLNILPWFSRKSFFCKMIAFLIQLSVSIAFFPAHIFCQIQFQRHYGSNVTGESIGSAFEVAGGYVICGGTSSGNDALTLRIDYNGNILWSRKYDAGGTITQTFYDGCVNTDGSMTFTGYISGLPSKVLIVKTDANGSTLWTRSVDEPNNADGMAGKKIRGGAILSGLYGIFYIGTDLSGNINATKFANYWSDCGGEDFTGNVIAGYLGGDMMVKDLASTYTYGGAGADYALGITATSDGGYAVCGYSDSFNGGTSMDIFLMKLDGSLSVQWVKTYGGAGYEHGTCVQQTSDGGFAVMGVTSSFGAGNYDVLLIKTDAGGDLQWAMAYGGSGSDGAGGGAYSLGTGNMFQTPDNGFLIASQTDKWFGDIFLIKTNASGISTGGCNETVVTGIVTTDVTTALAVTTETLDPDCTFSTTSPACSTLSFSAAVRNPCTATPIEILSFRGYTSDDGSIRLAWEFSEENTPDFFIVECSTSGEFFEAAGTAQSEENQAPSYSFTDESVYPGIIYYRLRYTTNGTENFSQTIEVLVPDYSRGFQWDLKIYPNPVRDYLTIEWDNKSEEILYFEITDCTGKKVKGFNTDRNVLGRTVIEIKNFPGGVYIIKGADGMEKKFVKF